MIEFCLAEFHVFPLISAHMSSPRTERRARERAERKASTRADTSLPAATEVQRTTRKPVIFALVAGAALGGVLTWGMMSNKPREVATQAPTTAPLAAPQRPSLGDLSTMSDEELARVDIGLVNLLCAEGLPRKGKNTVDESLAELDRMVAAVRQQTAQNYHRWQSNPAEFENSEAYFRVALMATILSQDFGVRYNTAKISAPTLDNLRDKSFYDNADDVLLSGCLGAAHEGTCASMPVLAVAVGRRLGYPMKLTCAKAHLFCRWEDHKEKRNFEYTNGVLSSPDDYYRKWPFPITEWEEKQGWYLKSLTPRQELAVFLSTRAEVLNRHRKFGEALLANTQSSLLWPRHRDQGSSLIVSAEGWFREMGFAPQDELQPAMQQLDDIDPLEHIRRIEELNARLDPTTRNSGLPPASSPFGTMNPRIPSPFKP